MLSRQEDLEEYARARLAAISAGQPPLVTGPRRGAPAEDAWPDDADDTPTVTDLPAVDPRAGRPTEVAEAAVLSPHPAAQALAFTRGHLRAVAAVVLAALLVCTVALGRARSSEVPLVVASTGASSVALPTTITTASPVLAPPSASASASGSASVTASMLEVHVLGRVRRPGVVRLAAGSRVDDALRAAGGLLPDAAPAELNLAAPLADADQVVVGPRSAPRGEIRHGNTGSGPDSPGQTATTAATVPAAGRTSAAGSPAAGGVVDLNQATAEQLDQLPGVGPVTAQRILEFRTSHQRFTRVEELQEVDGIGPKTYAQIAPHVRV